MTFNYPLVLTGFLIFIPLFIYDGIKRKKINLPKELQKKLRASVFLFRLFLAFGIIALAGPRWGMGYAPHEYRRGLDIVFAIDVSRSMDIDDASEGNILQTRLERGLSIARECIISVPGARFAAAIGRSRGYLAVPLTFDNEAAMIFLETLDVTSMTGRSTNLEALVDAAASAFHGESPAHRVIILISDGEAHTGALRNAINRCAREGIIINAVAVGSDEGRLVQSRANDPQAPFVISRREGAAMRAAAERTGGIYIDGNREDASSILSNHLLSLAHELEGVRSIERRVPAEPRQRRAIFIILALIAYAGSKFVTRHFSKPSRILLASIIAAMIFTSCSQGKIILMEANFFHSRGRYEEALSSFLRALNHEDAAAYAEYGLGLTLYSLEQNEAALLRYRDSKRLLEDFSGSEHRELRFRNHFNSGIIHFEDGDYRTAADAFREALRADSRRVDAKRNLELSLLSISMEPAAEDQAESRQEQREILFDFLREEEERFWRNPEWIPEEEHTGPDL